MNWFFNLLDRLVARRRQVHALNELAHLCQSGTPEQARAASKRMHELHATTK